MKPNDFIFNEVYRGAIKGGAKEPIAKDQAVQAMDDYAKGKFKKPLDLILARIQMAKKLSK